MKHFILYLFFILLIIPQLSNAQKFTFKEIKHNTVKKDFKKVLILGFGAIETRLFLENLSAKIIDRLKTENIEAEYQYLGKKTERTDEEIKNRLHNQFDAFIVFSPLDTSLFSLKYRTISPAVFVPGVGTVNATNASRTISYTQNFDIQLYEPGNGLVATWEAALKIDCDFSKQQIYSTIVKTIFVNF